MFKVSQKNLRNDTKQSEERKTLTISTLNKDGGKFNKNVKVNKSDLVDFIDFASECSFIRKSGARNLYLQKKKKL